MMKTLLPVPLVLAACAGPAWADATLSYELTAPDGGRTTKTLAVSRFFARIEDSASPDTYLVYQAGKFFPLYEVNPGAESYTRLTPPVRATLGPASRSAGEGKADAGRPMESPVPPEESGAGGAAVDGSAGNGKEADPRGGAETLVGERGETEARESGKGPEDHLAAASAGPAEPPSVKPALRATREKRAVAGIECRVVEELRDGRPVIEHCMANKARLGVTEREVRTLARTFTMARERNLGWLAAGTEDEEFVSISSRDLASGRQLVLKSVSTAPLPQGHLRIPRPYRLTNP